MYKKAVPAFFRKSVAAFFLFLLFNGCAPNHHRNVTRSFYYWKSVFKLTKTEEDAIDSLRIQTLYIKFFDIQWDEWEHRIAPVAAIRFDSTLPKGVQMVPVVFITNETFEHSTPAAIDSLARNMASLMAYLGHGMPSQEVQIDCDWNRTTKEKYFQLLHTLREQPYLAHKTLSATIRLHQLKYRSLTGVPPVDKGLLMCYNMGNLRKPETKNSILDGDELQKYTGGLSGYPLPLDVALPVFDWYVWFRGNEFKGLMHSFQLPQLKRETTHFERDTSVNNYAFAAGDWLRYEGSAPEDVLQAAKLVRKKLKDGDLHVILYHLDEDNLKGYSRNQLEAMYDMFR